ncbi:MAG: cytochrome c maturation protein CcmE [Acidimicrobiia bacterium]|nr:cytochrome c maturation protein CcmE [Acidimicrobiia bacterium]
MDGLSDPPAASVEQIRTDDAGGDTIVPSERTGAARGGVRRWLTTALAVLAFAAVGFVLFKGLTDAALFFRNADEAVADRDDLGESRFRLQGLVVDGSVEQDGDLVLFAVEFNDIQVDVAHEGSPPQLFAAGIPVVLEGNFVDASSPVGVSFANTDGTSVDGYYFSSDRILVKHDNEYEEQNEDRLDDARLGSESS